VIFLSTHAINRDPAVFETDRCQLGPPPEPSFRVRLRPARLPRRKLARLEMLHVSAFLAR